MVWFCSLQTWLFKPGMPPVENQFDQELMTAASDLAKKWHFGMFPDPCPLGMLLRRISCIRSSLETNPRYVETSNGVK